MQPLHASDLASWSRCAQAFKLEKIDCLPRKQLSATAYGSVVHHALEVLERTQDVDIAVDSFAAYWHPMHIEAITEPVDIWLPRQTFNSLLVRGMETIRRYAELKPWQDTELLATELSFTVPVPGTHDPDDPSKPLMLAGTMDKLVSGFHRRFLTLEVQDHKSGKKQTYLRHNIQGTAYLAATERPEFWLGNPDFHTDGFGPERGQQLMDRFAGAARKFTWIDLNNCEFLDGGFRGPKDYARLAVALQQMADSIHAEIFPLSVSGEHCNFCHMRDWCAGIGVDDQEGKPQTAFN